MEFHVLIFQFFTMFHCINSCLVNQQTRSGSWEQGTYKRKLGSCSCGKGNALSWGVDIKIHLDKDNTAPACVGVIITSNLIATSHKCLTWRNKTFTRKLNTFEVWQPKVVDDIVITPKQVEVITFSGNQIVIDQIILHPRHVEGVQSFGARYFEFDIALLRIKDGDPIISEILGPGDIKPMCIPTLQEAEKSLDTMPYYIDQTTLNEISHFKINPGKDCESKIPRYEKLAPVGPNTVCMKYKIAGPSALGDPLYVKDNSDISYLTGITSYKEMPSSFPKGGMKFVYFTHARDFVQYLEKQAVSHGSTWCTKPKATFVKKPPEELYDGSELWHTGNIRIQETLDCACGHPNTEFAQGRIMNGVEATPYEFGWMVMFEIRIGPEGSATCGGSIINDKTILTAAHCVIDESTVGLFPFKNYQMYARVHKAGGDEKEIKLSEIEAIYIHPAYLEIERYKWEYNFDVALIILKKRLQFPKLANQKYDSIVPLCLPKITQSIKIVEKIGTVAGWGFNHTNEADESTSFNDALFKLSKPILPLDECEKHGVATFDTYVCGSVGMKSSPAGGDSGGPLFIREQIPGTEKSSGNTHYHYVQVGIVSFGVPTSEDDGKTFIDYASVYTNVQKHLSFINYYSNKHDAKWCKSVN